MFVSVVVDVLLACMTTWDENTSRIVGLFSGGTGVPQRDKNAEMSNLLIVKKKVAGFVGRHDPNVTSL